MEFHVLGPLQVGRDGGVLPIVSAYKPRLMLAALLSRADQVATVDWLIGAVWGDHRPASARRNLQHYVHRLRAAVGSDRIVSRPGGYLIHAGDGLDATRFRRLAAAGRAALAEGEAVRAAEILRTALDLWRGPAYAEFVDSVPVADEATRLEELRLSVYEQWAEAQLSLGDYASPIQTLSDLVRAHPYREMLRVQLMRALYGAGRQADALEQYRNTRELFAEQLGIEPGPQLQSLHQRMLRGEAEPVPQRATAPAAPARRAAGGVPVPRELPADVAGFAGREDALKALAEMLPGEDQTVGPVVISAIAGTAGVGKTALAVHWAHLVANRFPDGQLYLNLRGYAPARPLRPIEALTTLLTALGTPPQLVPVEVAEAAARYRSLVAGRRMLIVLDNARSSRQVRPLLPASTGSLVLITSRDRLTGLVAHDGARRLTLDVLAAGESVDLLTHVLGIERVRAEPAAAAELARICAHLPLALRIAGAGLADQPHHTIGSFVAKLTERDPVATLAVEGDEEVAVRAAFDVSYRTLPEPAREMFRRLGLVPCPDFSASAAAALAGTSEPDAVSALDMLAAAHLVVEHSAGRYTMHDLLRQYAFALAIAEDSPEQRLAAVDRLHNWLLVMSVAATELLNPQMLRLPLPTDITTPKPSLTSTEQALGWLDAERHNLVAAVHHAARHGHCRVAWLCADALRGYHDQRRYGTDWLTTARAALAAARAEGDPQAQAAAYLGLAHVHLYLGHYRRSIIYLHRTLALAVEAGWDHADATASSNLAIALILLGRTTESIEYLHRALAAHERIDWPLGRARTLDTLASAYRDLGRLHEGCEFAVRARALYNEDDAVQGQALAEASLGELYAFLGRLGEAAGLIEAALTKLRAFGSRQSEALCHAWLARIHVDMGRVEEAGRHALRALELADELGEPRLRALARHAVGLVHEAGGNHTDAIELHRAALTIAERVNIPHTAGEALLGLATAHHSHGHPQAAIEPATRALTIARRAGFAVIEGRALTVLGRLHHDLGDSASAYDLARRALTNHQRTGHRIGEAQTHLLLATILHHLGDHTTADHHGDLARVLHEQILAPPLGS